MLMKKLFYILAAVAVTMWACQKPNAPEQKDNQKPGGEEQKPDDDEKPDTKDELTLISDAVVNLNYDSEIITVKFTSSAAWTAEADEFIALKDKSGDAGENIELKATVQSLDPEESVGRVGSISIKAGGKEIVVGVMQGKVFFFTPQEATVDVKGGKVEFQVITNQEYEFKTYDAADAAFPWAPVTYDKATGKGSLDVAANGDYDARYAYIKFTVPGIQVPVYDEEGNPTEETEDYVTRFYVYQEGNASAVYTVALPEEIEHGALNENSNVTLAFFNGNVLMSDGVSVRAINPDNGSFSSFNIPETLPVQSITNDDAGNVLLASAAGYGATIDIYAVKANATDFSSATKVATGVVSAWTGAPIADNVRAKGDVFGNGVISVISGGGPGCGSISYGMYWEVENGVAGEAKYLACPEDVTDTIWLSNRGCFAPAGVTAADGFLYIGYDGLYTLYFSDGTNWIPVVETGCEGNEGFNAIASITWKNKKIVAFEEMFYFPFWWSANSAIWLVDVTSGSPVVISHTPVPMIEEATPATEDNYEGSTSDILLHIEGDNLAVYVVDSSIGVLHKQVYK